MKRRRKHTPAIVDAKHISYKSTVVSDTVLAHCLGEELGPQDLLKDWGIWILEQMLFLIAGTVTKKVLLR